jgi:hypothetical protein
MLDSPGWKQITGGREESLLRLCRDRASWVRPEGMLFGRIGPRLGACCYVSEYVLTLGYSSYCAKAGYV